MKGFRTVGWLIMSFVWAFIAFTDRDVGFFMCAYFCLVIAYHEASALPRVRVSRKNTWWQGEVFETKETQVYHTGPYSTKEQAEAAVKVWRRIKR